MKRSPIDSFIVAKKEWEFWMINLIFDPNPNFKYEFRIIIEENRLIMMGSKDWTFVEQIVDERGRIAYIPI